MNVYQFADFSSFYEAAKLARNQGSLASVHTPVHRKELDELLGPRVSWVNRGFYGGGITGILTAMLITLVPNLLTFPINVGGKPLFSWPAFAIIGFELMMLLAGLGAVAGFFWGNRFPRYDLALFELDEFHQKQKGEYFLVTSTTLDGRLGAVTHHHLPDPE